MKRLFHVSVLVLSGGAAVAAPPLPSTAKLAPPVVVGGAAAPQFMTTVQFAVLERNAQLTKRSQKLVVDEFEDVFHSWPEFEGKHFEVKTEGPEVVFYMTAPNDIRQPMERAVTYMIQTLNGRVRARGRTQFYRTSLEQGGGGFLEVRTDDTHSKILSVAAQAVPLRDILKEVKAQVGGLSYLIPGECADQLVDWSFGEDGRVQPKPLDAAMKEVGALFNLRVEKQSGTYVFSGACDTPKIVTGKRAAPVQTDFWNDVPKEDRPRPTAVFFPVPPIAR